MLDYAQLRDLPLTVLIILGAYWVIQRHNDEFAQKLIALIAEFSAKYQEILDRGAEEREESRQRWLERDRLLITTIVEVREALVSNALQSHALKGTLQPLVLWLERERRGDTPRRATRGSGQSGEDADATG